MMVLVGELLALAPRCAIGMRARDGPHNVVRLRLYRKDKLPAVFADVGLPTILVGLVSAFGLDSLIQRTSAQTASRRSALQQL